MTARASNHRSTALLVAPDSAQDSLRQAVRGLYVTTPRRSASWLHILLTADPALSFEIEPCTGDKAALARLRQASFDVVCVQHIPGELDAIGFVEAHRATGAEDPLVVFAWEQDKEFAPRCYDVGADACLACDTTTAREVAWAIGRAIQWRRLLAENRRLVDLERQRLRLEHNESERLLDQQRGLISGLGELSQARDISDTGMAGPTATIPTAPADVPTSLVAAYRDLLRAYVIMGSGNLAAETGALVHTLSELDTPTAGVMQLHLHVLEETLRGLGGRSARHVMARADLLVLEVLAQLAERYRQRSLK
ncbi:MAG TPA: hypothetical protein VHC22_09055 [Pirellulales bacterium]|nr:hypothetical protein [Pirellulales bacterium]